MVKNRIKKSNDWLRAITALTVILSLCILSTTASADSGSETEPEPYPDLNSFVNQPARCSIKPGEAIWLREQIKKGNLRVAKPDDINTWENMAKANGEDVKLLDCGRTFVTVRSIDIPYKLKGGRFSSGISFIVPANISFPGVNTGSPFYDLKTGGYSQGGTCHNGKGLGIGNNPRECEIH